MKWYIEDSLSNFSFWGQAATNAKELDSDELDRIGEAMSRDYFGDNDMPSDVQINDIFAYDFDYALSLIGYRESPSGKVIREVGDLEVRDVEDDAEEWLRDNGYEGWSSEQLKRFCELVIENEHISVGGDAGEGGSFVIEFEALAEDDAAEAGIKVPDDEEKVEGSARRARASAVRRRAGAHARRVHASAGRKERKFNYNGKIVTAATKEQALRKIIAQGR